MDQVKEYLAVAMKHGFWIGSSVVLLGSIAVWFMSTSELDKKTASQTSKINNNISSVSQYRSEMEEQPNDISHAKMDEMIEQRKEEVLKAWEFVFDAQTKILTWPEQLGKSFLYEFKYYRDPETNVVDVNRLKLPFEKYETHPPEGETVEPRILRAYEKYIGDQLPGYAAIAKTEWTADFKSSRGGGLAMGMGMEMGMGMGEMMMGGGMRRTEVDIAGVVKEPVVRWSTASQDAVLKDLFPWKGKKDYPSELDVYYSQENLWILRQLLQIVAQVNGDAKQNFEAKIREIKKIAIGRSVKFNAGTLSSPGSRAMGGMGMGMGMEDMMGMDDMMDGMDMGMMMGMGMGMEDVEEDDPGDNRYVNTAFEPITASDLRSAFDSNDPGQVAIAVAKRVPVMLQFQMDQRSVPALLAACGSAPLTVDVHQVREMPKGQASTAMGGDMMGGMGGMDEMMGGMDEMMGGMGGMGGAVTRTEEEHPLDMDVEIYGLIYFYNPPNEESLGIEKVTTEVAIDESAETIESLPDPAVAAPAGSGAPAGATAPADSAAPVATPPDNSTAPDATGAGTPPTDVAAPVAGG